MVRKQQNKKSIQNKFEALIVDPMRIYANVFAEKVSAFVSSAHDSHHVRSKQSPSYLYLWCPCFYHFQGSSDKQRALIKSVNELEAALDRIKKASTGDLTPVSANDGGLFGLFGGGSDVVDPFKVCGIRQRLQLPSK